MLLMVEMATTVHDEIPRDGNGTRVKKKENVQLDGRVKSRFTRTMNEVLGFFWCVCAFVKLPSAAWRSDVSL